MKKCIRCGTEMKENCGIKVQGGGYGIVRSAVYLKQICCVKTGYLKNQTKGGMPDRKKYVSLFAGEKISIFSFYMDKI